MPLSGSQLQDVDWPEEGLRRAIDLLSLVPGDHRNVIDVGAHHGETMLTVKAALAGACDYRAIEPNAEACVEAQEVASRLSSEAFHPTLLRAAAGSAAGTAIFLKTKESAVAGLLAPRAGLDARVPSGDHEVLERIEVPVVTLDDVVREAQWHSVDLLKVDAEGFDLEVLRGAGALLRQGAVRVVLTEVFFVSYREGQAYFWDIATYLGDFGYYFVNLFDTRETQQGRLYTGNALWVSPDVARLHDFL